MWQRGRPQRQRRVSGVRCAAASGEPLTQPPYTAAAAPAKQMAIALQAAPPLIPTCTCTPHCGTPSPLLAPAAAAAAAAAEQPAIAQEVEEDPNEEDEEEEEEVCMLRRRSVFMRPFVQLGVWMGLHCGWCCPFCRGCSHAFACPDCSGASAQTSHLQARLIRRQGSFVQG